MGLGGVGWRCRRLLCTRDQLSDRLCIRLRLRPCQLAVRRIAFASSIRSLLESHLAAPVLQSSDQSRPFWAEKRCVSVEMARDAIKMADANIEPKRLDDMIKRVTGGMNHEPETKIEFSQLLKVHLNVLNAEICCTTWQASEQRLQQQFAELRKGERAAAQEFNTELQSAAKTIKALEKEVKGLRKEVGAFSGMKKEMRELQRSMAEMRQQPERQHPT